MTSHMQRLEALATRLGPNLWRSQPATPESIRQAEAALGVTFPPSYRAFLERWGALAVIDVTISGILDNNQDLGGSSVVGDTLRARQEHQLPERYIVIQSNYMAPYCLDMQRPDAKGEVPAICYELYTKHAGVIAASFGEWVEKFFIETVPL